MRGLSEMADETQNMIEEFQAYQQQLQSLLIQKESFKLQTMEIEKALEELSATKEKAAYKITGGIMVSKPVEELKKELQDTKETVEVRMKSFDKTEEKLNNKLKELQEKLQVMMK